MTIIFSGNNFKYEIEAIVKLFCPAQSFSFLYNIENVQGDYVFTRLKKCKSFTYLYTRISFKESVIKHSIKLRNLSENTLLSEKDVEFSLCRMVFLSLQKLTGIAPLWGMLTGIRPVKRINLMLDNGLKESEITSILENKFYVSTEKAKLALSTAIAQKPFLAVPKNSFSLYISIPFCPSRCNYCSFVSHSVESSIKLIPSYIAKLCEEISITAKIVSELGLKLDTIYIGGGTPTALNAEELATIMDKISASFNLFNLREYTVEAGRADTINFEKLSVIKDKGATRISINPQTMNDAVLEEIGRKHTVKEVLKAFEIARNCGFNNINMDLIAGLKSDTFESFVDTINQILELSPENITVHSLSLKRASKIYSETLPQTSIEGMISYSSQILLENNYFPYYLYRQKNILDNLENVGYSKAGCENLYNILIMEESQTILALGSGGSTKLVNETSRKIHRIYNYKFPYEYINRFDLLMEKKKDILNFYKEIY